MITSDVVFLSVLENPTVKNADAFLTHNHFLAAASHSNTRRTCLILLSPPVHTKLLSRMWAYIDDAFVGCRNTFPCYTNPKMGYSKRRALWLLEGGIRAAINLTLL